MNCRKVLHPSGLLYKYLDGLWIGSPRTVWCMDPGRAQFETEEPRMRAPSGRVTRLFSPFHLQPKTAFDEPNEAQTPPVQLRTGD